MPLEVATTIEQLDQTWPLNGDLLKQGAAHIKQVKSVLKLIFPGSTGNGYSTPITATEDELNFVAGTTSNVQAQIAAIEVNGLMLMGIIQFSGFFVNIPANYQLCDGTNGTPDMTNSFVYGTATQAEILNTGGSADSIVTAHGHTYDHGHTGAMDTLGVHSHTLPVSASAAAAGTSRISGATSVLGSTPTSTDGLHNHIPTIDNVVGQSSSSGVVGTDLNTPSFIKLAFIQRMT